MDEQNPAPIDIAAILAELSTIETRRTALLETLRAARAAADEVLACFAPAKAPKAPRAPKAPGAAPAAIEPEALAAGVELVRAGNAKDVPANVMRALKRKGLVQCTGRGTAAVYTVVES